MQNQPEPSADPEEYRLNKQIGYLLRLASQRHAAIFQSQISENLTPTQFSTLITIAEHGPASQNHLGRLVGIDVATIKGVVDRLKNKNLINAVPDPHDKRRTKIYLSEQGAQLVDTLIQDGQRITKSTLKPLKPVEQKKLIELLSKLI